MRTIAPFLAILLATLPALPGCLRDLGIDARPYACRLADPASCGAGWVCVAAAGSTAGEGVCIAESSLTDDGPAPDPGRDDGPPDVGVPDVGVPDDGPGPDTCAPDCTGRKCGDDGCGGSCGECAPGSGCADGRCVAVPICDDSCMKYQVCLRDCPNGDCACDQVLTDPGRQRLQALDTCRSKECAASSETPAALERCLLTRCAGDYLACYSGCKFDDCFEMTDCIAACGTAGTATCALDCAWNASVPARKDLLAATTCDADRCPACSTTSTTDTAACDRCRKTALVADCRSQWDRCLRTGTRGCQAAHTCLGPKECGEFCGAACVRTTSQASRDLLQALWACLEHACPLADLVGWDTCVKAATGNLGACREEYDQCE